MKGLPAGGPFRKLNSAICNAICKLPTARTKAPPEAGIYDGLQRRAQRPPGLNCHLCEIGPKIFKKGISSVIAPGALSVMV